MDSDSLQGEVMSNVVRALRRAFILATLLSLPVASFAGFFISNGQLVDNNGTPFIMRGVNYPYTWFQSRNTQADLAAIAATGSNTCASCCRRAANGLASTARRCRNSSSGAKTSR
jgi:mannan endo-1,4-beta-mannosidase